MWLVPACRSIHQRRVMEVIDASILSWTNIAARSIIVYITPKQGGPDTVFAPVNRPHFLSNAALLLTLVMALVFTGPAQAKAMHSLGVRYHDAMEAPPANCWWLGGVVLIAVAVLLALALLRKALRIIVAFAVVFLLVAACIGVAYWGLSSSPAPCILQP